MNKVCFIVNHHVVIYNFRKEIVRKFLEEGVEVHIISPAGPGVDKLVADGAIWHDVPVDRHGTSIKGDLKLYKSYKNLLFMYSSIPDIIIVSGIFLLSIYDCKRI